MGIAKRACFRITRCNLGSDTSNASKRRVICAAAKAQYLTLGFRCYYNSWGSSRLRQRRATVLKGIYGYPTLHSLSVLGIGAFGIWTLSKSKTIKADSGRVLADPRSSPVNLHKSSERDHNASGQHAPPPQTTIDDQKEIASIGSSWSWVTSTMGSIKWTSIPEQISEYVVPEWLRLFPAYMTKLQNELSMAPGTLAEEIWMDASDPDINPEITRDANVRISDDICMEERKFLEKRKWETRGSLAKYLGIPVSEVHPDDIPTIAMCGSGGGLRALVAGSGSYIAAREAGLFDCITYTAGVSGSCWLQTLYFTSTGKQSHTQIIQHLKNRLGVHLAYPPAAFNMVTSAPTNKFLLTGLVEKLKGTPNAEFGIVDIYGLLLAARLLVPKTELGINFDDLKLSSQQQYLAQGQHPLPIYSSVRHEIRLDEAEQSKKQTPQNQWFQWFEFTPYEFWCEEMGAGIPTWAVGREFNKGKTVWRENGLALPESRISLLMGIWGSAFCATLSHYYKEIRPVMKTLAGFGGIDQIIADRDGDLIKVHPIDPAAIPNFAYGMQGFLPQSCTESLYNTKYLHLMDSGMSNNLPIYPLLRPGRNVDVVIAFDASADVKTDNWLKVVDGYARQRNIIGWPIGAGWPTDAEDAEDVVKDLEKAQAKSQDDAMQNLKQAQAADQTEKLRPPGHKPGDLGYCNVWVGGTAERTMNAADIDDESKSCTAKLIKDSNWDTHIGHDDAGVTLIYYPLLPNPSALSSEARDVDPRTSDFLSTWNFVYTANQIDQVVALARANFEAGADQTKRTIRAVYERKKRKRLEREARENDWRRRRKLQSGRIKGKKLGEGDHGDHFS